MSDNQNAQQGMNSQFDQNQVPPQGPQFDPNQAGQPMQPGPQFVPGQQGMPPQPGPQIDPEHTAQLGPQFNPNQMPQQGQPMQPNPQFNTAQQYNPNMAQQPYQAGQLQGMNQQFMPGQQAPAQSGPYMGYNDESAVNEAGMYNYSQPGSPYGNTPNGGPVDYNKPQKTNPVIFVVIGVAALLIIGLIVGMIVMSKRAGRDYGLTTEESTLFDITTEDTTEEITTEAEKTEEKSTEEKTTKEETTTAEATTEAAGTGDGNVTLSENPADYTFELNGVAYKIPCPVQNFVDNGWTIVEEAGRDAESELAGTSYDWFDISKDDIKIGVHIFNPSGNAQKAKDCKVGQIEISADDPVDFKLAKGITAASTFDEIKAAYGEPSEKRDGEGYSAYTYDFDEHNYYEELKFFVYENGKDSHIELRNMMLTDEDVTDVSTELPDYLSTYVAPTELGSDASQPVFKIDGKIYRLPCPLKEFTDDGWTISEVETESVGAGNLEYAALTIKKNDVELELGMYNFTKVATISENCAVACISVNRMTYDEGDAYGVPENLIEIPGGITLKTSREEAKKALGSSFEEYVSDDKDYYSYSLYEGNTTINLTYSESDDYRSTTIELKNTNWDY